MRRGIMEAEITINGKPLTDEQSAILRVALISARSGFIQLGKGIETVGHIHRLDDILLLIDETKVAN